MCVTLLVVAETCLPVGCLGCLGQFEQRCGQCELTLLYGPTAQSVVGDCTHGLSSLADHTFLCLALPLGAAYKFCTSPLIPLLLLLTVTEFTLPPPLGLHRKWVAATTRRGCVWTFVPL